MKLNVIQKICKSSKRIELYSPQSGVQWIGDGGAIYPIYDLPRMSGNSVFTLFDIPEGKRDKIALWQYNELPKKVSFYDYDEGECLMEQGDLSICFGGGYLIPLKSSLGAVYINKKYLEPFKDSESGVQLYERNTSSGAVYIVVKEGLLITGVIFPYDVITDKLVEELGDLYKLSQIGLDNKRILIGSVHETCQEAVLFMGDKGKE